MAEIFEIEDVPQAVQEAPKSAKEEKPAQQVADKHVPTFDFNGYPPIP